MRKTQVGWPQGRKRTKTGSIKQNRTHGVESLNIMTGNNLIVTQKTESRLQQKTKHLKWNHIQVTLWRISTGESRSGVSGIVTSGLTWQLDADEAQSTTTKTFCPILNVCACFSLQDPLHASLLQLKHTNHTQNESSSIKSMFVGYKVPKQKAWQAEQQKDGGVNSLTHPHTKTTEQVNNQWLQYDM